LGERAGEEGAFAAHGHGVLVEVVHELVDEREGDELDLVGGEREFADEEVAAGVEAALGFGGEHGSGVFGERRAAAQRLFGRIAGSSLECLPPSRNVGFHRCFPLNLQSP
jgi:hypothetical protein